MPPTLEATPTRQEDQVAVCLRVGIYSNAGTDLSIQTRTVRPYRFVAPPLH